MKLEKRERTIREALKKCGYPDWTINGIKRQIEQKSISKGGDPKGDKEGWDTGTYTRERRTLRSELVHLSFQKVL